MKRLMLVCVIILCLVPVVCMSEQPDRLRLETVAEIARFVSPDSTAVSSGILRIDDHDSYTEYTLANEYDTGEAFEYVPTAVLRSDLATGSVIYYRQTDYPLPTLTGAREWTLMDGADEATAQSDAKMISLLDWASHTHDALLGVAPDETPAVMICSDQRTCIFVLSDAMDEHVIDAMLICTLPSTENELPQLKAYVDLVTNPDCGYDGCITAHQASDAGREAIRARFGNDAAAQLTIEYSGFVLFNYGIDVDVSTEEVPDAGYEKVMINPDHPTWVFVMIDQRADPTCAEYVPGHEDAYRYYVAIDAFTGEVVQICDEPEEFAFG
jgi:hypothetical protein